MKPATLVKGAWGFTEARMLHLKVLFWLGVAVWLITIAGVLKELLL